MKKVEIILRGQTHSTEWSKRVLGYHAFSMLGFDWVVHRRVVDKSYWDVSEATCGKRVTGYEKLRTRQAAIDYARVDLQGRDAAYVAERVRAALIDIAHKALGAS